MARRQALQQVTVAAAVAVLAQTPGAWAFADFRSGQPWLDAAGNVIDAHGGGMLQDGGAYYWCDAPHPRPAAGPVCGTQV